MGWVLVWEQRLLQVERAWLGWGWDLGHPHPIVIDRPGALVAPDRVRDAARRLPGETAFVLTRTDAGGPRRYAGVARWIEEESLWAVPYVDHPTWKALGVGRSASRRLPEARRDAARAVLAAAAQRAGEWLRARGQRCRVVGTTKTGNLRIDGGPGGFAARTVTITDVGWVLEAWAQVAAAGGVLDEARVNRLRYLDGTPKEATRWIDTGWALVVVEWVDGAVARSRS